MKKTKLKWTKKLPTVDGFYWWRFSSRTGVTYRVVVRDMAAVGVYIRQEYLERAHWGGEWYGPIPSKEPK